MREIEIRGEDDIIRARRAARDFATVLAFSLIDKTRIATAVSELARNTLVHGGGGRMQIATASQHSSNGIRCVFIDEGPGILDIDRAMGEGFSSASSLGQGLPGAQRLSDDFHIESTVGVGTRVEIVKWLDR